MALPQCTSWIIALKWFPAAIQGQIDFLPNLETNLWTLCSNFENNSPTSTKQHIIVWDSSKNCARLTKAKNCAYCPPYSRKPCGLNLSSRQTQDGTVGCNCRVLVDLAIFYHDTLISPPSWWKRRPQDHKWDPQPTPSLVFTQQPLPMYKSWSTSRPTYYKSHYSQRSCESVMLDLFDSIFVWRPIRSLLSLNAALIYQCLTHPSWLKNAVLARNQSKTNWNAS